MEARRRIADEETGGDAIWILIWVEMLESLVLRRSKQWDCLFD